ALAQALTRAVAALLLTGFSADALRSAEEAVPLYEAAGEWTALCQTLHLAAVVHTSAGNFVAADRHLHKAAAIAERVGDPVGPAFLGSALAHVAFFSGAWEEARRLAEQSVERGRQIDPAQGLVLRALIYPLIELGRMCLVAGAIATARA